MSAPLPSARAIAEALSAAGAGSVDACIEALRRAVEVAASECFSDRRIEAMFVDDEIGLYAVLTVVEDPATRVDELALSVARAKLDPAAVPGDEMLIQIHYLGTDAWVAQHNAANLVRLPGIEEGVARWRAIHRQVIEDARRSLAP